MSVWCFSKSQCISIAFFFCIVCIKISAIHAHCSAIRSDYSFYFFVSTFCCVLYLLDSVHIFVCVCLFRLLPQNTQTLATTRTNSRRKKNERNKNPSKNQPTTIREKLRMGSALSLLCVVWSNHQISDYHLICMECIAFYHHAHSIEEYFCVAVLSSGVWEERRQSKWKWTLCTYRLILTRKLRS